MVIWSAMDFVDRCPQRLGAVLLAMLSTAGCTEEFVSPQFAAMRALCDEPAGPIRVLSVSDNERVVSRTRRYGERWVVEIDVYTGDAVDAGNTNNLPDPETRVVSVDACGDDRQVHASGLLWARRDGTGQDAVWLGCEQQTRELLWIDPQRPPARRSLGPSGDPNDPFEAFESGDPFFECGRWLRLDRDIWVERPTMAGLSSIARMSVPSDGEPVEHEVIDGQWVGTWAPEDGAAQLFLRDGTEIRVRETDGGEETLVVEVDTFEEANVVQGRYVRITDLVSPALRVFDRQTGNEIETEVSPGGPGAAGDGWSSTDGVMLRSGGSSTTLVWLPELEAQELPGAWQQPRRLEDGRVVLLSLSFDGPSIHLIAGPGATPMLLADDIDRYYGVFDDAVLGLAARPENTFDFVSIPLDGSSPQVLVPTVQGVQAVTGGRWATMRDVSSKQTAELLLVDGDGEDVGRVDTDTALRFGPTFAQTVGRFEATDWLAWVVDRRGRRGLYYAELELPP